jgi:hypothetical protein
VKRRLLGAGLAGLCALSLSACIDSTDPILPDSQAILGPVLRLQLFSLRKGFAYEPEQVTYKWNGALYTHAGGGMTDVGAFSVHPFEAGDDIIETIPSKPGKKTEYALLHKIASGAYLVIAIDEADADEQTRSTFCKHPDGAGCRIETREQLFAFARATAARQKDEGGLAIRLPDGPEKPRHPAKRRH